MATQQNENENPVRTHPTVYHFANKHLQLIYAPELHQILGIEMELDAWLSEQKARYLFDEDVDFLTTEDGCFMYSHMAMIICAGDKSDAGKKIRLFILFIDREDKRGNPMCHVID